MFKNIGEKLKSFASTMFILSVIGFIILALVFGWQDVYHSGGYYSSGYTEREFQPVYFFTFLIAGPLASYIQCLVLSALGELVETSQAKKSEIEVCRIILQELKSDKKAISKSDVRGEET